MYLQSSSLGISASLMVSGTPKRSFGPYSDKLFLLKFERSDCFKNLPLGIGNLIWNFDVTNELQSESSNSKLKLRIYKGMLDVL